MQLALVKVKRFFKLVCIFSVLYTGSVVAHSGKINHATECIGSGSQLSVGQTLHSTNGLYSLKLDAKDGALTEYQNTALNANMKSYESELVWTSDSAFPLHDAQLSYLQVLNGDAGLYDGKGNRLWHTGTKAADDVCLYSNGEIVVLDNDKHVIWSTHADRTSFDSENAPKVDDIIEKGYSITDPKIISLGHGYYLQVSVKNETSKANTLNELDATILQVKDDKVTVVLPPKKITNTPAATPAVTYLDSTHYFVAFKHVTNLYGMSLNVYHDNEGWHIDPKGRGTVYDHFTVVNDNGINGHGAKADSKYMSVSVAPIDSTHVLALNVSSIPTSWTTHKDGKGHHAALYQLLADVVEVNPKSGDTNRVATFKYSPGSPGNSGKGHINPTVSLIQSFDDSDGSHYDFLEMDRSINQVDGNEHNLEANILRVTKKDGQYKIEGLKNQNIDGNTSGARWPAVSCKGLQCIFVYQSGTTDEGYLGQLSLSYSSDNDTYTIPGKDGRRQNNIITPDNYVGTPSIAFTGCGNTSLATYINTQPRDPGLYSFCIHFSDIDPMYNRSTDPTK